MQNKILNFVLVFIAVCLASQTAYAMNKSSASLQSFIDAALAENPALLAARDRQMSADYKVDSAGALADPFGDSTCPRTARSRSVRSIVILEVESRLEGARRVARSGAPAHDLLD